MRGAGTQLSSNVAAGVMEKIMAGSVNKVILVGNLGKDPEVRRMTSGEPVVNLSVATSESWRDKASGERKEKTEWQPGGDLQQEPGRSRRKYLRKGAKVYVEGQLQTRKWTDKDGAEKYSTEVVLQNFRGELTMHGLAAMAVVKVPAAVAVAQASRRPASSVTNWMTRFLSSFAFLVFLPVISGCAASSGLPATAIAQPENRHRLPAAAWTGASGLGQRQWCGDGDRARHCRHQCPQCQPA